MYQVVVSALHDNFPDVYFTLTMLDTQADISFQTTISTVHIFSKLSYFLSSLDMKYEVKVTGLCLLTFADSPYATIQFSINLKERTN